jgi:hypothetical protein
MTAVTLLLAISACSGAVAGPSQAEAARDTVLISTSSMRVPEGGAVQLSAEVRDEQGRKRSDLPVVWYSSDETVATVSDEGTVRGVRYGQVTIKASSGRRNGKIRLDVGALWDESLPAFPGAQGWGASALNRCRSMPTEVLAVTSREEDGPGSLAQAMRDARSDRFSFIVFETGGVFSTPQGDGVRLNSSCVYLAGQTAPGDGVTIQPRGPLWLKGGGGNIGDIVIRYLRLRGKSGQTKNNLIIAKGERIVLDHLSLSWADNYIFAMLRYGGSSVSAPISHVSVQNSIASEVFSVHPTGPVLGSNEQLKTAEAIEMANVSLYRNLWAHNSHRNPMTAADNAVIANNVIYNWQIGAGMMNRRGTVDWIGNYGKAGPMTREDSGYMVTAYCDDMGGDFSIFAAGNVGPRSGDPEGDNWSGATRQVACYHNTGSSKGQAVPAEWRRDVAQDLGVGLSRMRILPAPVAYQTVLADVGANQRLECDGTWVDATDAVDRRVIEETRSGTGVSAPLDAETQVGGLPVYREGNRCDDEDIDGLPDKWEDLHFDCKTCADRSAVGADGYLLMEHYLNGTVP